MRAFLFDKYKQPLYEADVPEPTAGPRDVVIQIEAAGVNHLDERLRSGQFASLLPYKTPLILGHDLSGTVIKTGAEVTKFTVGDRVYSRPRDFRIGTFAERIAVDEEDTALAPTSVSSVEAASLPLVSLTAWQALVECCDVQPEQKVLIHAGAGGVGSFAIQLAKHLGAYVATTVSEKHKDFVRSLGADTILDYRTQDFTYELSGYDVVLDSLGGKNLTQSLRVLKQGGKAVGIAGPPTPSYAKQADLNPLLRFGIAAISYRTRQLAKKLGVSYEFLMMRASGEQLSKITDLVDSGAIRPIVGATFSFDQTVQALASLSKGSIRGKTVIVVTDR